MHLARGPFRFPLAWRTPWFWSFALLLPGLSILIMGITPRGISSGATAQEQVVEWAFVGALIGALVGSRPLEGLRPSLVRTTPGTRFLFDSSQLLGSSLSLAFAAALPSAIDSFTPATVTQVLLPTAHITAIGFALHRTLVGSISVFLGLPALTWLAPALLQSPQPSPFRQLVLELIDPRREHTWYNTPEFASQQLAPIAFWIALGIGVSALSPRR